MRTLLLIILSVVCISWSAVAQSGLIDKVVAVVGKEMVLLSDVESEINLMRLQGTTTPDADLRCEVFENLLLQTIRTSPKPV